MPDWSQDTEQFEEFHEARAPQCLSGHSVGLARISKESWKTLSGTRRRLKRHCNSGNEKHSGERHNDDHCWI